MNKSQLIGGVIETVITDEELHLAQEPEEPEEITAHPAIMNKSIMTAYTRAKKASIAQNNRARRIVTEMRERRVHNTVKDCVSTSGGQTTIFEFG